MMQQRHMRGWKSVWAGDTAAACPSLVRTQAVRRGWRLGAPGRLEPTPPGHQGDSTQVWVEVGLGWRHRSRPPGYLGGVLSVIVGSADGVVTGAGLSAALIEPVRRFHQVWLGSVFGADADEPIEAPAPKGLPSVPTT